MAVTITNDAATTRTNLGLGDAATKTVGTASGNIPVLDSSGKLASGRMPTFKTVGGSSIVGSGDISTLPSGGTANQVLTSDASSNATWADAAAAGKVLQVVSMTTTTDTQHNTTSAYATDVKLSITPSKTTSKILVMSYGQLQTHNSCTANTNNAKLWIYRNGSDFMGNHFFQAYCSGMRVPANLYVLDSPNTLSSVEYKVYLGGNDTQYKNYPTQYGSMVLIEIGA